MSKKYLTNVDYLEENDISSDGSIVGNLNKGKNGVIMLQGLFCGHCGTAKPAIQSIADAGKYYVASIQIDGGDTEKAANKKISTAFGKDFRGVPHYYFVDKNGKFFKHYSGGRSREEIENALAAM
jgi:hypothetical protein